MNFINPFLLLFAAAASVPLLLHLFNKQRVKIVEFSTVQYLRTLQKTRMRRVKIRQILLLILRTLILLSVAVAFARPTIEGGYLPALGGKTTTTAVLLIDISGSCTSETNQGSFFEKGIERAEQLLSNFTEKEKVTIIAFGSDIIYNSGAPSSDFDRLRETLKEIAPSSSSANPPLAFHHAYQILKSCSDPNLEIYLISDLQGEAWKNFEFTLFAAEKLGVKLFVLSTSDSEIDNLSVDQVHFPSQIITAGRSFALQAAITNRRSESSADVLISLELADKKVAQTDLSLPPEGTGKVTFNQSAPMTGFLWGSVSIDDDDLRGDNNYYFGLRVPSFTKIAILSENDQEAFHLQKAMSPLPGDTIFKELALYAPEQFSSINLFDYDAVVVGTKRSLPSTLLSALKSYAETGGATFFLMRPDIDVKDFSERITGPLFGLRLLEPPPQPQTAAGKYQLNKFNTDHPVFSPYKNYAADKMPEVEFLSHFKTVEAPSAKAVARFSDNSPAILEGSFGKGKSILYTFSLDDRYSDLIYHPLLVVMLNRTIEYLISEPLSQRENLLAGEEVTRTLSAQSTRQFVLVAPGGDTTQLSPNIERGDVVLNLGRLDKPGIYRILGDGTTADIFALNFPQAESDLTYLEPTGLAEKVVGAKVIVLESKADPASAIASARFGKELWKLFLLLGFVFLLIEMAIASGGKQPEVTVS